MDRCQNAICITSRIPSRAIPPTDRPTDRAVFPRDGETSGREVTALVVREASDLPNSDGYASLLHSRARLFAGSEAIFIRERAVAYRAVIGQTGGYELSLVNDFLRACQAIPRRGFACLAIVERAG